MSAFDPFERIAKLDQQSSHSSADRKNQGITYTPVPVARAMVKMLSLREDETIMESSCGRGVFVFVLAEYWRELGKSYPWIDEWAQGHLFVCDMDEKAVEELGQLWLDYFQANGHSAMPLNSKVEDGLFGPWSTRKFDVAVGNPPYVRIQNLNEKTRGRLREKYTSCQKGNVDIYYAFLEDALERCGRVCMITPNSWLSNDSAKALRNIMLPRLTHLIDFQSRLLFAPVRAYTAIVLLEKTGGQVIHVRSNLPGEGGGWHCLNRSDPCWGAGGFTPLSKQSKTTGVVLADKFEVLSGIATLADHAFVLPSPRVQGGVVYQADPLDGNREIAVPMRYAPRMVKITKPGMLDQAGPRILYPYEDKKIVNEADLRAHTPGLLAWLGRRRNILDGRDKGKTQGYEAWYAYGRKQGLWEGKDELVILVPTMGNGKLVPMLIKSKDISPFLFVSGYVIRAKQDTGADIEGLVSYLSGPEAWTYVQQHGKAWAGKGDYRTIGARALRNMPLPAA